MIKFILKFFSYNILFLTGDTLVLDRWLWLKKRIKLLNRSFKFIDVGCGAGQFVIGLNKLNFLCDGVDVDTDKLHKAKSRADLLNLNREDMFRDNINHIQNNEYDGLITFECIEHIINDKKFIHDCSRVLKKNGYLFLTTPYKNLNPITSDDLEISTYEDGGHVRVGYDKEMLFSLLGENFYDIKISYCSGFLSQKLTYFYRRLFRINKYLAMLCIFPLRPFQIIFDNYVTKILNYKKFSICVEARKN